MHLFAQSFFYSIISEYIWPIHLWYIKLTCKTCNEIITHDFIKSRVITNLLEYMKSKFANDYDTLINLIKDQKAFVVGGIILRCIYSSSYIYNTSNITIAIDGFATIPEYYQKMLIDYSTHEYTHEYIYESEDGNINREYVITKRSYHRADISIGYVIFYKPSYISINKYFNKAYNVNINRNFLTYTNNKFMLHTKHFNDILNKKILLKFNTKHRETGLCNSEKC